MHMLYLQFYFQISMPYTIHNYYFSHDHLSTGLWIHEKISHHITIFYLIKINEIDNIKQNPGPGATHTHASK